MLLSSHAVFASGSTGSETTANKPLKCSALACLAYCATILELFSNDAAMDAIAEKVKNSAYEIISKKQATYYGIAMSVKRICECIVRNERSILPVSAMMHGEYGIEDITLSMPAIVGIGGVETHVPIALSEEEAEKLVESAKKLKEVAKGLIE